ncbi:SDR family NAD(P)-dependent oxidoreductase [Clostridium boliviensis]|uniref:SDR family NAD(P)-dependent oxidoreductase n=1 Tax=Clostridium boliviensis TaxID=318465 RepID=A0ABU4GQZ0_9CLOT|nr:SDR family NAD(P)-dependent oxidoreductase [Clostridium boliviensis]MDW2800057.1 SDR family NAD(P)-dependent oxidoreductase [Clostridium boliviensis]
MKNVALITGATSGLGLAYAKEYAKRGYNLIITGRREDKIKANAVNLENTFNVKVKTIIVDLANEEGLDILLSGIRDDEIEVLVNNAGFGLKPFFSEVIKEDIDRIMFLQMNTVVILTQNVLKQMLVRDRGTIINISSDGAFAVMPRNVLYSSTKLFILNFTEGLYMELIDSAIRVQVVCPGFIDSDFHESAGMNVVKKKTGFMKFMDPDKIVHLAMRDLKIGRVVSLPGLDVKIIQIMKKLLPRKMFYKIIISFARKMK